MTIPEVATRARRRLFWNEAFAQGMCALSVGLAGMVLLLVTGTQLLDWRWLVVLPAATIIIGIYRTRRRLPDSYAALQIVDRRLQLADTLSTALYFGTGAPAVRSESMRQSQMVQAERMADGVDVTRAIPYTMPRAVYATGLLAFIATSLFALRYGLERRLDLRAPLAAILEQSFGGNQTQLAALQKKRDAMAKRSALQEALGLSTEEGASKGSGELDAAPDSALETSEVPDADNSKRAPSEAKANTPDGDPMEGEAEGDATDGEQGASGQDAKSGKQGGNKSKSGEQNAGNDPSGSSGENSSLMSKLRDAMSNLLSRMKQQPNNAGAQQQAANQKAQQGQGQKGAGQKGKSGQGKQQQGGQDSDAQDGDQGEQAQNAQNAQGRGAGQSTDDQASKQPGSGIGKQDGNKDVKLAEQVAAMGKISEIIGKRSANVSGDVTVEVQNSNQQLKTAWVQQNASHTNSGGEINRDEVPVEFQTYVQQYFEQVRKLDAGAAKPKAK